MIYTPVNVDVPLRQGDIFIGLPRIDISLESVLLVDESGEREAPWRDLHQSQDPIMAIVPIRSVAAIVATQDCDAARSPDITLCEIRRFRDVDGKTRQTEKPKAWKNILTQHARINQKWFYLPPDTSVGFEEKMAADFLVTMRLPRAGLENLRTLRVARLNDIADEHFRERIAEFFRRYPYDEWYALDEDEMTAYQNEYPDARPFTWQQGKTRE